MDDQRTGPYHPFPPGSYAADSYCDCQSESAEADARYEAHKGP